MMLTVFSLIMALAPTVTAEANSADKESYEVRYAYTMNLYDSTEKMQQFTEYYENESGEYFYPEYFAGFKELEDGKLALLVTDDSEAVQNTVWAIIGEDVSFIKVEHSFNELYQAEKELWKSDFAKENDSLRTSLNLQENVIEVYLDEAELTSLAIPYSENSLFCIQSTSEWERKMQEIPEGIQPLTEEELHPEITEETEMQGMERAATTIIYPGMITSAYAYDDMLQEYLYGTGTTGFCALDTNGNRLVITHGHNLVLNGDFSVKTPTGSFLKIGETESVFYDELKVGDTSLDFSVIKVKTSNLKISNRIDNQALRITNNIAHDYILKSYINTVGYAYGRTSGEINGSIGVVESQNRGVVTLTGHRKVNDGDSGGPIYMKVSSNNGYTNVTLLGIISAASQTGPYSTGCTIQTIKNNYNLNIYQNNTDY